MNDQYKPPSSPAVASSSRKRDADEEEDMPPSDLQRESAETENAPKNGDKLVIKLELDSRDSSAVVSAASAFHAATKKILPFDQLFAYVVRHKLMGLPQHEIRTHSEDDIARMLLGADYNMVGKAMTAGVYVNNGCETEYDVAYITPSSWLFHRMSRHAISRFAVLKTDDVICVPIVYVCFCVVNQLIELYLRTYMQLTQILRGGGVNYEDEALCDYIEKSIAKFYRALRESTDCLSKTRQPNINNAPMLADQRYFLDLSSCTRAFILFIKVSTLNSDNLFTLGNVFSYIGLHKIRAQYETLQDLTANPFGDVLLTRPVDTYNLIGCWLDNCFCDRCSKFDAMDMSLPVTRDQLIEIATRVLKGAGVDLDFFQLNRRARAACMFSTHRFRKEYANTGGAAFPALVKRESGLDALMERARLARLQKEEEARRAAEEKAVASSSSTPPATGEKKGEDEKTPLVQDERSDAKTPEKKDDEGGCSIQ